MDGTDTSSPAMEWWIERLPASALNRELDRIKDQRREGWDVTVLVELAGPDVIVLGCRFPFATRAAGSRRAVA